MAENATQIDIAGWIRDCIEGHGGMNDYESREAVVWHVPERVAAATWIIRCLANPSCQGSAEVISEILARRRRVLRGEVEPRPIPASQLLSDEDIADLIESACAARAASDGGGGE